MISSVQLLSHVWLFATPWITARQASLSITNSQSSQTHVHRVSDAIQPSHPLLSPSPPAPNPSQHQSLFQWVNSLHEVAKVLDALASVLPMNTQDWCPLEWTGWISLQFKGLSRVFPNTTVQKHQFFSAQPLYGLTLTSICGYWKNRSFDYTDLCWQSDVFTFKYALKFVSFPGGSEVKASASNAGDPGSGRSPGEGNGNPLQYSCLENPMDREAWWATVHGVPKSWTHLSDFTFFHLSLSKLFFQGASFF